MRRLAVALIVVASAGVTAPAGAAAGRCPRYERLLAAHRLPVRTFSAIMWRESGCQAGARHVNRNGTVDRGLLQLNSIHLRRGGVAHGYGPAQLYNPATNIALAARLYKRSGMRPWR